MRHLLLSGGLLALLSHAAPAVAQVADSNSFTPSGQMRIGLYLAPASRVSSAQGLLPRKNFATFNGIEASIWGANSGGLQARYEAAAFGGTTVYPASGDLSYLDARGYLGTRTFALIPGFLSRSFVYNDEALRLNMFRGGLQVGHQYAGAGIALSAAALYSSTFKASGDDELKADGIEAETAIRYFLPRHPVFVQLGYRRETLDVKGTTTSLREEVSMLVVMVGVHRGFPKR